MLDYCPTSIGLTVHWTPFRVFTIQGDPKSSDIALQVIAYGALTTGGTPSGGLSLDISQKIKVGRMKF